MKKIAVLLANGFEDIEAITVIDILRRSDVHVTTFSNADELDVESSHEITIKAEQILRDNLDDYDGIYIPGGGRGTTNLANNPHVLKIISDFNQNGKLIAGICAAPSVVLNKAGVLDNHQATCYPSMEKLFNPSVTYQKQKVVIDNNIITSEGAGTSFDLAFAILDYLNLDSKKIKNEIVYY